MLEFSQLIYLCHHAVDMSKSIDGLVILVDDYFRSIPTDGSFYVFCNQSKDKIKILRWDRNGFCLWYKRLERDRFLVSYTKSGAVKLEPQQLRWLLDGLDYSKLQGYERVNYQVFF